MKNLRQDEKNKNLYWLFDGEDACFCPLQFPTLGQTATGQAARTKEGCSSNCALFNMNIWENEDKASVNLCHNKYDGIEIKKAAEKPNFKPIR